MKAHFLNTFILCALQFISLGAEIENVTVTWSAIECKSSCINQLEQQFRKIPGVAEISMNQSAGQADLKWKKNATFSFSPINIAMEMIGLTINDIRVRVHGILEHTATHVTLISSGDLTHFDLINPVVPTLKGQAPQFNLGVRGLQPALREKLLAAETEKKIATIEGPLFMPERSPPLELVVSSVSFSEAKKEASAK
jgi:hypothetical protein